MSNVNPVNPAPNAPINPAKSGKSGKKSHKRGATVEETAPAVETAPVDPKAARKAEDARKKAEDEARTAEVDNRLAIFATTVFDGGLKAMQGVTADAVGKKAAATFLSTMASANRGRK